ncbi:hypothetical protein NESM_000616500 [Novymonas esmeraldas]|uniref:Probable ubiquitin carboxyl-terminal hydrolase MINDY-4 n=1 Tax=Novymonas esmeraldas TaxID=1808958 RepID=A0AAW0ERF2_9TRYP
MPPKKAKDLANAPVLTMAHEDQVRLLSDALLREYMHRRGFLATLKAFDEEHPRDADTISSRALMSDLMALDAGAQQRMKGEGVETIMEMLCNLRVERRLETERLTEAAHMPLPKVPANYEELKSKVAEREARVAGRQQHKTQSKRKKGKAAASSGGSRERGVGSARRQRQPQQQESSRHHGGATDAVTMEDLLGSSHSSGGSGGDAFHDRGSDDEEEEEDGHRSSRSSSNSSGGGAGAPGAMLPTSAAKPAASVHGDKGRAPAAAQPAWATMAAKATSSTTGPSVGSTEDNETDIEDGGGAAMAPEQREQLSAAFQLLCGFDGGLPRTFLEQGFVFDDSAADCTLIQWHPGGCDGVIAPVQAFVAAYHYERELYVGREQRQRDCLARALCTSLEQAQPNASKIVLVDGGWRAERGADRYMRSDALRQAAAPRTRCWTHLASMQEVTDVVRDVLLTQERWMKPRGAGLASFLFSLLLSRGVDVVQQDLAAAASGSDGRRPTLMVPGTGGATLSLANLVLMGRATPFHHNGVRNGNQTGYGSRLRCGLLCGDAAAVTDVADDRAQSGVAAASYTNAVEPHFASWVLWHKGRFANLYMPKDTRQVFQQKLHLGGSASVDLVYWDASTEDDEYALTVTVRSVTFGSGSGGVRNAKSFVNVAIATVPAWSSAAIDWNGAAPLRD